ncbi:hypothetical protein niasHT_035949 [Heterodera trifolii]|uniref:Peptidase M41 domain-containing protein n=1 Tax=Heterodera trifolii TaxID=157864 RepID=A0ABD2J898_9BILA
MTEVQKMAQQKRRKIEARFRKSMARGNRLNKLTNGRKAFHETGHLWMIWMLLHCIDVFLEITIIPDAVSDAAVFFREQKRYTRRQLKAKLLMSLGEKTAEQLFFDRSVGHGIDETEWIGMAKEIAKSSRRWNDRPRHQRTRA